MNSRPAIQMWLPLHVEGELFCGEAGPESPSYDEQLMERVVERDNLIRALKQVERNGGSPGIDGMTVEALAPYLKHHWPRLKEALLRGAYIPQPVKRVEIPKPGGGVRKLGIPTVVDRFIQQAILQVLQPEWDPEFSESSFGFRPGRNAHQAVTRAQRYVKEGYTWVVDMDVEKFFDRVNHDKLMSEVAKRVKDRRILRIIRRFLEAGVLEHDALHETTEGTPQGGPLSPLLANLLLDKLDRELERREHRFVRYADDCNIYVRSRRAGCRVMRRVSEFLSNRLKLKVNEAKSAVARPWQRKFLGFGFSRFDYRRRISLEAIKRFKERVREISSRTRGRNIAGIAAELGRYLRGWKAYFGFAEALSPLKELDSWIRRRLRCYLWKQWGRRGYRELRNRGVSRDLAWNTAKSAHGPWRLSRSPGLAFALPASYFVSLGVPTLYVKGSSQPNRRGT
ncbi:MAG: ltrA [Firmicutes bacterium]|nr:ltrA [Bacillota bacterium]